MASLSPERWLLAVLALGALAGCTTDQRRRAVDSAYAPQEGQHLQGRLLCDLGQPDAAERWKLFAVEGVKNVSTLTVVDGTLRVESPSAAGLFYYTGRPLFDPRREPLLAWRWRVSTLLPRATPLAPDLDNFPARLLVGFDSGWEGADSLAVQWKRKVEAATGQSPPPRAICYTFGGELPSREAVDALFGQGRIVVINLRGREASAGAWYDEVRDVASDYRAIFGEDPPPVTALAVAADTQRVQASVEARFSAFRVYTADAWPRLSSEPRREPERQASPLALWLAASAAIFALALAGLYLWKRRPSAPWKSPPAR